MKGKLVILSAPSGSGKTTIVSRLLQAGLPLEFSVSATSRPPRSHEHHGHDYYFFSAEEFRRKIQRNEFVEWEEVYSGQYYGTLKSEVERIWSLSKHIIFDVDVIGGLNIKKQYGNRALAVFVMPPSVEAIADRLRKRETEDDQSLKKRLEKAAYELTFAPQFDVVIVNDYLEDAVNKAISEVSDFLN
ncbi:MAG: guanylate kinase [Bacteroidia bacterium]|nr:guanylate kinase [Bacteroidia bacterium]